MEYLEIRTALEDPDFNHRFDCVAIFGSVWNVDTECVDCDMKRSHIPNACMER